MEALKGIGLVALFLGAIIGTAAIHEWLALAMFLGGIAFSVGMNEYTKDKN